MNLRIFAGWFFAVIFLISSSANAAYDEGEGPFAIGLDGDFDAPTFYSAPL